MTYTELIAAIKGYAENEFPSTVGFGTTTQLNTFIRSAEQKIYITVRLPHLRAQSDMTLIPHVSEVPLPSDFLAFESAALVQPSGTHKDLPYRHVTYIREAYPDPAEYGVPAYIAIKGPGFAIPPNLPPTMAEVGPTPDDDYTIKLNYLHLPVSITDPSNDPAGVTWLSENLPNALLYGSMEQAALFMQHEELAAQYQTQLLQSLQELSALGRGQLGTIA